MTYPCPSLVRCHRYSINLNELENELFVAIANYQGKPPSTVLRDLVLASVVRDICLDPIAKASDNEATNMQQK